MRELLTIRRAKTADITAVMAVMDAVTRQMSAETWFVATDAEVVMKYVDSDGFIMVAEDEEQQIVAAFMICYPGDSEDNLGRDLQLSAADCLRVAHMDTVIVLPEYRGHRLQQRLLEAAEQELKRNGYEYLMCTIHPENKFSLNNMKKSGYRVMLTKEKYGGKLRHILCKTSRTWQHEKPVILVSACLLGVQCRYNGGGEETEWIRELAKQAVLIPVCPEVLGGLPTPREPAERVGAEVLTISGADVTEAYDSGARQVLELAQWYHASWAILKERSPSCGSGRIYDGTHSGRLIPGDGMTAKLLKQHQISVFNESQADEFNQDFAARSKIIQKDLMEMSKKDEK